MKIHGGGGGGSDLFLENSKERLHFLGSWLTDSSFLFWSLQHPKPFKVESWHFDIRFTKHHFTYVVCHMSHAICAMVLELALLHHHMVAMPQSSKSQQFQTGPFLGKKPTILMFLESTCTLDGFKPLLKPLEVFKTHSIQLFIQVSAFLTVWVRIVPRISHN